MKKLEEDETIKDKGEQTRAANCTLPKKDKNVQKMPKTFQKADRSHIIKKNAINVQKVSLKICLSLFWKYDVMYYKMDAKLGQFWPNRSKIGWVP